MSDRVECPLGLICTAITSLQMEIWQTSSKEEIPEDARETYEDNKEYLLVCRGAACGMYNLCSGNRTNK